MSAGGESSKAVIVAFFANLGIAISKFFGAFVTSSASLLAEAIHSLVDCTNQVLLLVGSRKAGKPADERFPLGYGRESFFWSFIVAILLFSLGGVFAIYEGIHKMSENGELSSPRVALAILLFGILLESYSFWACMKEIKAQNRFGDMWTWFRRTSSVELLVVFTEDVAALCGLIIATVCLLIAWATGDALWDAIGSVAVGSLLVVVAVLLAVEIKSFIIGEACPDEVKDFVAEKVKAYFPDGKMLRVIGLQTGSNEAMVSYKFNPGSVQSVEEAIARTNQLERAVRARFPYVKWQFAEMDRED